MPSILTDHFDRLDFEENYRSYQTYRFWQPETECFHAYQFAGYTANYMNEVLDLVDYVGTDGEYFYWIAKKITTKTYQIPNKLLVEEPKIRTLIPGDVVKIKFRGMRTKFKILSINDVITKNCVYQNVAVGSRIDYEKLLNMVKLDGEWIKTNSPGDYTAQHVGRVYLQQLTNI
jgi:hypothetical protein